MSAPGHGLRRWATATAAIAIPLGAVALAAVNILDGIDATALAETEEATVTALEARVSALAASTGPARDRTAVFLRGETPAIARAELQKRLGSLVETVGGKLIETQDAAEDQAADAPDDGRVAIRVTFDVRNDGLLRALHDVEAGLPLLTVDRIEARKLDAATDADPEDPTLRVSLTVGGRRRVAPS